MTNIPKFLEASLAEVIEAADDKYISLCPGDPYEARLTPDWSRSIARAIINARIPTEAPMEIIVRDVPSSESGYVHAFYEIAAMLGIGARAKSPASVWQDEIKPKLQALAALDTEQPR